MSVEERMPKQQLRGFADELVRIGAGVRKMVVRLECTAGLSRRFGRCHWTIAQLCQVFCDAIDQAMPERTKLVRCYLERGAALPE
jgi:hypothetical protein